jgi:hypothetical protein
MADPAYRFLPWTRRGLAAAITQPDGAAVPARVNVSAGITVSGAGDAGTQLQLYGPGDIAGVDPRVIVRMEPRPASTDVEPNYVAAIEFDPPDFPWVFTPAAPDGARLRPWCVLVVVDSSIVSPPHLAGGAPLPVIDVPAAAIVTELPDLAESWAWAHTQVLTTESSPAALQAELKGAPNRQLSRLLCPRRLEPGRRYCACLVPAFSVGVVRGLGGVPAPDATIAPAWTPDTTTDVRLPVYYHWEFATGAEGDFESLARALKPFKCDASAVGVEKMFIGDAGSGMPALDPADAAAVIDQDGALRAPLAGPGTLAEVPAPISDGLRAALDTAASELAGAGTGAASALGAPLYGAWHLNRHSFASDAAEWLAELNLDPRMRVAAGLGAEVVRVNQEDFMRVCWDQVGRVLDANEALSRAALALEAGRRVHERHFRSLPPDMLTQIAAPLHGRVRHAAATVKAAIGATSLPDATTDAAMRRLTSGQRPVLKKLARRSGAPLPTSRSARPTLARSLAGGRSDVDPGRYIPGGVVQLEAVQNAAFTPGAGTVDLAQLGLPMQLSADQFSVLKQRYDTLQSSPSRDAPRFQLRSNILATGLVTSTQLADLGAVSTPGATTIVDRRTLISDLITASVQRPGAVGFLVTVGSKSGETRLDALDVDTGGNLIVRPPAGGTGVVVGTFTPTLTRASTARLGRVLADLPPNTLDRRGRIPPELVPISDTTNAPVRPSGTVGPLGSRVADTVAPLTRDPIVIQRFQTTFQATVAATGLDTTPPARQLVSFDLAGAGGSILLQTDPQRTVRLRTAARIRIAGQRFDEASRPNVQITPAFDRIMVAPAIATALYELLARYDRTRLLPGVDAIPENGITLLETNPRFVGAFLVGANHEMNSELLWRRYPTDRRGTPLGRFWDWVDDGEDVTIPIHGWTHGGLTDHLRGSSGGQLVLLVRGRLLRRYPNSVIYAWRAAGRKLKDPPGADDLRPPAFAGQFAPDITFVGFDLTFEEITEGDGWFFVIQQQPTEPRFGFDEEPPEFAAVPPTWSDATWAEAGVAEGRHLTLAGNPLSGTTRSGATFGADAAHMAAVLLQKPMRVALHGSQLAHLR